MSRKIIVYIAISLDGFIAKEDGSIDFLQGTSKEPKGDPGYETFYQSIDTVIMGRKTYTQIVEELSPNHWVYEGKDCLLVSHTMKDKDKHCKVVSGSMKTVVEKIRKQDGKDLWLVGGANVIKDFLEEDLIDRFIITIIPVLLGQGIPLFSKGFSEIKLHPTDYKEFDGMVQITYDKRES